MASVWYAEVVKALNKVVKTMGNEYSFSYRNPEEVLSIDLPGVTVIIYDEKKHDERIFNRDSKDVLEVNGDSAAIRDKPHKYSLFVQVDLWATNMRQMSDMSLKWISSFDNKGYLESIDNEGNTFKNTIIRKAFRKDESILPGGKRVLQRTYSYEIWTYVNESEIKRIPVIKGVKINTNVLS